MRKPVLAHDLGGPSETVVDGETGWLIPSCDVESILVGLLRALADCPRWSQMGKAGRERSVKNFSIPRFESEVTSVVEIELTRFLNLNKDTLNHKYISNQFLRVFFRIASLVISNAAEKSSFK